jgi:hypothetical protein
MLDPRYKSVNFGVKKSLNRLRLEDLQRLPDEDTRVSQRLPVPRRRHYPREHPILLPGRAPYTCCCSSSPVSAKRWRCAPPWKGHPRGDAILLLAPYSCCGPVCTASRGPVSTNKRRARCWEAWRAPTRRGARRRSRAGRVTRVPRWMVSCGPAIPSVPSLSLPLPLSLSLSLSLSPLLRQDAPSPAAGGG